MRLQLGTMDVAAKWDAGPNPSLPELAEDRGLAPPHARCRGRIPMGPMKGLWEMPYSWTQLEVRNNAARCWKRTETARITRFESTIDIAETMEGFIREASLEWRVHRLSGARSNGRSVSVSGICRITFEERNGAIWRVDLEDCH